jgi:short subunit dehydrogenase-like uncharacterized protein
MRSDFMLYGANGYTGRLITECAVARGLRPLLAGRSAAAVSEVARAHDLEHCAFELSDVAALDEALSRVQFVVHAAGPFAHTALRMVEGCIRTRTHYVDITGEIEVFEQLHGMSARAATAGVMLLPGAGFDVVPTDQLALHLKERLPSATRLRLGFFARGGSISRGTMTTMVENAGRGGAVRIDGRITRVPAGWRTREIDFGFGTKPVKATTIPWGDVATAYYTTGIPNIEVYARSTAGQRMLLKASRRVSGLIAAAPVQRALKSWVRARVRGPDAERRRHSASLIWGEVEDGAGRRATARMRTPEGYTLTAMTAVEIARRVIAGQAPTGFQTPSLAFGPDWILKLEGVTLQDA